MYLFHVLNACFLKHVFFKWKTCIYTNKCWSCIKHDNHIQTSGLKITQHMKHMFTNEQCLCVILLKYPACNMSYISFMNGIISWTKKTFLIPFHSWFISLIPEFWYITNIYMGPWMLMVHGGMVTSKKGAIYFTTS